MKRIFFIISFFALLLTSLSPVLAQTEQATSSEVLVSKAQNLQPDEYYRAKVTAVLGNHQDTDPFLPAAATFYQTVEISFLDGPAKDQTLVLSYYPGSNDEQVLLKNGDQVVVQKSYSLEGASFNIVDRYRFNYIIIVVIIFVAILLAVSGWVGLRSLLGLAISVAIILGYMLPAIVAGQNPMLVSILGASGIALISIYVAHGFKKRTSIALLATFITLLLAIVLAVLAVQLTKLFGLGSEEALYLQLNLPTTVNLRGLLLGAIIIGLMGVLDDITTAQSAVVEEINRANPSLSLREIYRSAMSVGQEHIASLINTLALAYVGASLPLLLLLSQYPQPLHIILNRESIAEEIIRTIVGSATLILAVPITTLLATWFYGRKKN